MTGEFVARVSAVGRYLCSSSMASWPQDPRGGSDEHEMAYGFEKEGGKTNTWSHLGLVNPELPVTSSPFNSTDTIY